MKEYIRLNRQKIIYWTKVSLFAIGLLGFILSIIVTLTNDIASGLECMLYVLLFDIGFVILFVSLSIVTDYFFVFKKRLDFLNSKYLQDFFIQNQFSKTLINSENKYKPSRYEMQGCIGDFTVRTDTIPQTSNRLFFNFKVDIIPVEKERYKSLTKIFKESNAFFEFEGIFIEIDLNKNLSAETIKKRLYDFAEILNSEKIKPDRK
jgi:hypothetical protein